MYMYSILDFTLICEDVNIIYMVYLNDAIIIQINDRTQKLRGLNTVSRYLCQPCLNQLFSHVRKISLPPKKKPVYASS